MAFGKRSFFSVAKVVQYFLKILVFITSKATLAKTDKGRIKCQITSPFTIIHAAQNHEQQWIY